MTITCEGNQLCEQQYLDLECSNHMIHFTLLVDVEPISHSEAMKREFWKEAMR